MFFCAPAVFERLPRLWDHKDRQEYEPRKNCRLVRYSSEESITLEEIYREYWRWD